MSSPPKEGADTHEGIPSDEQERVEEEEGEEEQEDVLEEVRYKPVRVHDILIKGNERTKDGVIERELEEAGRANTFEELQIALLKASFGLRRLGVFSSVKILVDSGPEELPETVNVFVIVKESGIVSANVGTYIQGQDKTLEGSLKLKNAAGYAETYDLNLSMGELNSNSFGLGFQLPFIFNLPANLDARTFQTFRNFQKISSHNEILRGFSLGIDSGSHEAGYELTWRENEDKVGNCSPAVRRQLGHSLLSSLRYSFSVDHRDSKTRPQNGYSFRSASELAGVGFNPLLTRFFRQEIEAAGAIPLGIANAALTANIHVGALVPWGFSSPSAYKPQISRINDRFFLGGPNSLRGFQRYGVGPTDMRSGKESEGRDSLGGDFLISASTGVSFDLPLRVIRDIGLHGQAFVCAGNLLPFSSMRRMVESSTQASDIPKNIASGLLQSMRCSAGVGLVWPTVFGRLEVNYCYILRSNSDDRCSKRGWQVGFSSTAP